MAPRRLDDEPKLCEPGRKGTMVLPLFGDNEQRWPNGLRIVLYMLGLGWCFMGVAIIADIFMGAIERITSQKVRKLNLVTGRWYTAIVWNPTVANLTLMALGSSAPEILLNVVETVLNNKMFSGDLGPSTIVGSAAFNLFIIIAVCVSAIPDGEVRRIKELPVYLVTALFSIFAYVWMLVVLLGFSPHIVEPWEGVLTFLFFPVLVTIAYMADRGYFTHGVIPTTAGSTVVTAEMSKEELAELQNKIRREYGANLSDEQVTKIISVQNTDTSSRAHYRVAATRAMVGGKRVQLESMRLSSRISAVFGSKVVPLDIEAGEPEEGPKDNQCVIEFAAAKHAVLENAGSKLIKVVRGGVLDVVATVSYKTRDGSAKARGRQSAEEGGGDYIHNEGTLKFARGETEKTIEIKILDDNTYEEDEDFFVDLSAPAVEECSFDDKIEVEAVLGTVGTTTVVIIDDDMAGTLSWMQEEVHVQERPTDFVETFTILRKAGSKNAISCRYRTENHHAIAGKDFEATEGVVHFEDGVTSATVKVKILARGRYGTSESFRLVLSDLEGSGAKFDESTDGGENLCICTVHIDADTVEMERIDKIMSTLMSKWDKAKIGHSSWKEQFKAAFYVNGGEEEDDEEGDGKPSIMDKVMHFLTVPWKVLFAFCPPTDYCGGWACFCCSLLMIGLVTIVIGDMANLFGCVIPFMQNEITAITFVALGTSLPDTFASKAAATQDPYADNSVGNVTGSNSVNVFLGLGLPWLLASIFWSFKSDHAEWDRRYQNDPDLTWLGPEGHRSKAYVVKAGSLAFSVIIFTCCAICCLTTLFIRRKVFKGELGGPRLSKYLTSAFLVSLWLFYILMSILKISNTI